MPRLSIIIPFRADISNFEDTLLSVLENRPESCEIIVPHDGRYADPYRLADEVEFVCCDPETSTTGLLNAGLYASRSPFVNVVLEGATVRSGWSDEACKLLEESQNISTVAVALNYEGRTGYGVDPRCLTNSSSLRSGHVDSQRASRTALAPAMGCGFYRQSTLLEIGGWNSYLDVCSADVELSWILDSLEMRCAVSSIPALPTSFAMIPRHLDLQSLHCLGAIAKAFGIYDDRFTTKLTGLIAGLFSGGLARTHAWNQGAPNQPLVLSITQRLSAARKALETDCPPPAILSWPQKALRRAA